MGYEPTSYWSELHARSADESTVGYPQLATSLNAAMYRSTQLAVERTLTEAGVEVTGSRVLDVGSGTGVWIDFWQRRGAAHLAGVDLAEPSVERLRSLWPTYAFSRVDIGDAGAELPGDNDLVSAMSILLHIVDDTRFRRAVANLAAALRPGGILIAIEPIVLHRWWGPEFGGDAASKARPVADYRAALDAARLELCLVRPATVLLANVVDTRREIVFRALERYWSLLTRAVGDREAVGRAAASVLGPLDALAIRLAKTGPSAKVLVARRTR
jgi:SAM-dependent methyltransferase